MGNLLIPGQLNYLLFPVHSNLSILLNCNFYLGSYSDVHQVTKKSTRSIYIPTSSLKYFLTNTPASGKESIVVPKFLKPYETKLNIMEVMSSLIAYSSCSLSEKIDLAFEVFDFDHNQVITKDEMVILCLNFLNGISVMTQTPLSTKKFLKTLADEAFSLADSDPDGMITKQE